MQRHERCFGGFRLSPTPPAHLDEGSSRAKHALLAENARSTELPTEFRLPNSSTLSHQPPQERGQKYNIDSTGDKEAQNNPVAKKHQTGNALFNSRIRLCKNWRKGSNSYQIEAELCDGKGIDRLAMPQETSTPNASDIVFRTFVPGIDLVLTFQKDIYLYVRSNVALVGNTLQAQRHCCQIWSSKY